MYCMLISASKFRNHTLKQRHKSYLHVKIEAQAATARYFVAGKTSTASILVEVILKKMIHIHYSCKLFEFSAR